MSLPAIVKHVPKDQVPDVVSDMLENPAVKKIEIMSEDDNSTSFTITPFEITR